MILTRYYNMRRKLTKSGVIRKSALNSGPSNNSMDDTNGNDEAMDEEMQDAIHWLQNSSRSVALALEKWKFSSLVRVKELRKSQMSVQEYLEQYPILKLSDSSTLMELDFEQHYPNSSIKLFIEWPKLSSYILSKVSVHERERVEDCFTSDGKKVKTMRLLQSLFLVKTIVCKKRKQWRPSREESRNGLISYSKIDADLQPLISHKRKQYEALGIPHSPQAIAVSVDGDTITHSYVVINQVWWNIENPLKAIDVAFKTMHMLDTPYPKESCREFLFLQQAVYEISSSSDKKISDAKTVALIEEFKNFKGAK